MFLRSLTLVTPMAWDRAPEGEAFHGNDGKAGFQQGDWNRIAHQQEQSSSLRVTGLLKENSLVQPPIPWLLCQLFDGLKNIQGSQDGTESLVPHEGELSKHKVCFWQDKCKKEYSSLLGWCLVLEEIKLSTPWGGKNPQNMKIYGVCWTLIKYWTSHQSGSLRGRDPCVCSSACPQMGSGNDPARPTGAVGV